MTELEKLDAGLEYNFFDEEVAMRKENALRLCNKLNSIDPSNVDERNEVAKELFGEVKGNIYLKGNFNCDNGKNINVGKDFFANYNVTILDTVKVYIGDYCMIGPGTLITTVGHPLTPKARREKKAQGKPINIGNDVWIGGNCTILPGVTIGNNVVIAAGAVVAKDVPDNSLVAGVPAKVIRTLENDIDK